ncbi:hypothetical protein GN956_G11164 [Arapaima gigas]
MSLEAHRLYWRKRRFCVLYAQGTRNLERAEFVSEAHFPAYMHAGVWLHCIHNKKDIDAKGQGLDTLLAEKGLRFTLSTLPD